MEDLPDILQTDEFRQLLRDDFEFTPNKHKSTLNKERRLTDGMTHLMFNALKKWERHARYEEIDFVVRLTRDFQRSVCSSDQKAFQKALEHNGFVIDHQFFRGGRGRRGESKAVTIPRSRVQRAVHFIRQWHLSQHQDNEEFDVDWQKTFDFKGVQIPNRVRINTRIFRNEIEQTKEEDNKLFEDWHLQSRLIDAIQNSGWLEQNYRVSLFGRLVGTGISSLQSCPKKILSRLLEGCWQLDVNTASLVILYQEYQQRTGGKESFPALEEFIANKTRVRQTISEHLGIEVKAVKQTFTAIGFGMTRRITPYPIRDRTGTVVNYQATTLSRNLGSEENAVRFLEHEFVQQYWSEYQELTNKLTKRVRKENPEWIQHLKNELGKQDSRVASSRILDKRKMMAFLFQQGEARILRSICRQVGQSLVLPKHDAVVVNRRFSDQEVFRIEQGIQEETGYRIQLSNEVI